MTMRQISNRRVFLWSAISVAVSLAAQGADLRGCRRECSGVVDDAVPGRTITLTVVSGMPVVDGVFLNGRGPFRFLVDTGAQTNQVQASIGRKVGLTPTFRTEIATVAGSALVPGARVSEVALGSATASNREFLLTDLTGVHALAADIQGVLGQDFLLNFDYLLDFTHRRLVFGIMQPEGGTRMEMDLIDGRPVVETDRGRLVLDSGTDIAILFRATSASPRRQIITASGTASIAAVQRLRFRIAGRVYAAATSSVPQGSMQEAGTLPASLFHSIYVSNSRKYLILDPTRPTGERAH